MRMTARHFLRRCVAASFLCCGLATTLIAQEAAQPPQPGQPPVLPDTEVEATPEADAPLTFDGEPVFDPIVDGYRFRSPEVFGYRAGSSTAGTIIDVPDIDIPATVNVVPDAVIHDQQALRFDDILRNVGAANIGGDGQFADKFFMRGLEVNSRDFRKNGFNDSTYTPRDFQNVERVEFLKGPASVLYGASTPAGMVNVITKKPIRDQFVDFDFTFGSFQQERYTLDANGFGTSDGSVLYRFNAAYEHTDTFRDFGKLERTLIAPVVTWNISETSWLTWEGEFRRDDRRNDRGIPVLNGNPLGVPIRRYMGEPANDFIHYEDYRQQLTWTTELSDYWTFTIGAQSLFYEFPGSATYATGQVGADTFSRSRSDFVDAEQNQSLIANLAGDVEIFDMNHKILFGTEQLYYDSKATFTTAMFFTPPAFGTLNVNTPVYTNPTATPVFVFDAPVYRQQRNGFYVQDLVELNEYFSVLGGVRYDRLNMVYDRNLGFGMIHNDDTYYEWSPRGGIVFNPMPEEALAVYYNYSHSFTPPGGGGFNLTGAPVLPEFGELHELGIKTDLLENLSLNVAGFYITRENASFTTAFQTLQFGEERAQGAEINLVGSITERWSAIANYAYTDTKLTDPNNPAFFGQQQRNVPYNTANIWTRYNVIQNECETAGAALGWVYVGERAANLANSVELPSYNRWDAGVYYTRGRLETALYIENIFDLAYAQSSIDEFQIFPGAPANARAQIGIVY